MGNDLYIDRYRLERGAAVGLYALRIHRVAAAAGQFPEPVVVDRAMRTAVNTPAEKHATAIDAAAAAVRAASLYRSSSRDMRRELAVQIARHHARAAQSAQVVR